jgi:hypothetical protein
MGSKVAKKLGDGRMALFGYPLAQENESGMAEADGTHRILPAGIMTRLKDRGRRRDGNLDDNGSQPVGDYPVCTMLLGSSALCCFSSVNPVEHKALVASLSDFGAFLAITANALRAEVREKLSRFT